MELDADSRVLLMETIESSTNRLKTVIGNLLDMGRVNSNTVMIRRKPVQYADIIDAVCGELPEAAHYIDNKVAATTPLVTADAGLAQRIVANIVVNARTYASNSRIEVRAYKETDAKTVQLWIIDHGPGFPPEKVNDVFTLFQRMGDQSARTKGLGLGLSVARGFAEAMGGTLKIKETPGGGATLILTLPAVDVVPELKEA